MHGKFHSLFELRGKQLEMFQRAEASEWKRAESRAE